MDQRIDHYTALLIDAVLEAQFKTGIVLSTRSLLNLGLPTHVIDRVLSHPQARRGHIRMSGNDVISPDSTASLACANFQAADVLKSTGPEPSGNDETH